MLRCVKGVSVIIEVEFTQNSPFADAQYYDPKNPYIVLVSNGKKVVSALVKADTGRYYALCNTEDLPVGVYRARVYTEGKVLKETEGFELEEVK